MYSNVLRRRWPLSGVLLLVLGLIAAGPANASTASGGASRDHAISATNPAWGEDHSRPTVPPTTVPRTTTVPPTTARAGGSGFQVGNLVMNPSFEMNDPGSGRDGADGWTGTVYPESSSTNAVVAAVALATAPDGLDVGRATLNFVPTGPEFGLHPDPPPIRMTRAGAAYRATAAMAAASPSSVGKPGALELREVAPGSQAVVQTQRSAILLGQAFQSLATSLTVKNTGDSVDVYLLQDGASLSDANNGNAIDSFYADSVTLTAASMPSMVSAAVEPSIPTGCSPQSADVTVALNRWLDTVPDFSVLEFPAGACYHVEGSLLFFGRHNLVVHGNGSKLQAFTLGNSAPKPSPGYVDMQVLSSAWPSQRTPIVLDDSTDMTVQELGAVGPNTTCQQMYRTLPVDTNAQNGFSVIRSNRILLDRDTVQGVYGDLVAVSDGADHVQVEGGDYQCSGNVGEHVLWGTNVTFQSNKVAECGAVCFSTEPMRPNWIEQNILVDNNDVYPADPNWSNGGTFFTSQGAGGSNVGGVTISNNRIHGRPIAIDVEPTDGPTTYRSNFQILDNSSDTPFNGYVYGAIHLNDVSDVVIEGNQQAFAAQPADATGITRAVNIEGSRNVTVEGNEFPGVMRVLETRYLSTALVSSVGPGATTIVVAAAPDIFEPPLNIDGETRYVANSGVSGSGPYTVQLQQPLALAHAAGDPVATAANSGTKECQNAVTQSAGAYVDGLCQ